MYTGVSFIGLALQSPFGPQRIRQFRGSWTRYFTDTISAKGAGVDRRVWNTINL
jgi:hypothetical protein